MTPEDRSATEAVLELVRTRLRAQDGWAELLVIEHMSDEEIDLLVAAEARAAYAPSQDATRARPKPARKAPRRRRPQPTQVAA